MNFLLEYDIPIFFQDTKTLEKWNISPLSEQPYTMGTESLLEDKFGKIRSLVNNVCFQGN